MSEPVVYMLQDEDDVEFNTVDRFSCGRTGGIPLYLHPDPRVSELEAVLRECREVIEEAQTYCEGPQWSPSMAHDCCTAIAKIDDVLK